MVKILFLIDDGFEVVKIVVKILDENTITLTLLLTRLCVILKC